MSHHASYCSAHIQGVPKKTGGKFKERGEQYGTIWDNMEIGATMICLHLKPD